LNYLSLHKSLGEKNPPPKEVPSKPSHFFRCPMKTYPRRWIRLFEKFQGYIIKEMN
jgi:hypothetical protein